MGMFDYFWAPDEGVDVGDIRELVPFVVEKAPGADPNEIRRALAAAVNCFLKDTGVWRKEGAGAYASEDEVRVGSGGCARVISVEAVYDADGVAVYRASDPYARPFAEPVRDDGSGVFVLPMPGAAEGDVYTADICVTVRLGSELCPVWVMERYGEAIAFKAAHELLAKGQFAQTTYIAAYRAAVQGVIARKAMGGSSRSASGSAVSTAMERI